MPPRPPTISIFLAVNVGIRTCKNNEDPDDKFPDGHFAKVDFKGCLHGHLLFDILSIREGKESVSNHECSNKYCYPNHESSIMYFKKQHHGFFYYFTF